MALSSSLPLITISFFLSILAGHAVRDLPKSNNINISDVNVSAGGFVVVATLYPAMEQYWAANCFSRSKALLTENEDINATLRMQGWFARSSSCSDFYIVQVGSTIVSHCALNASIVNFALSFAYTGFQDDIYTYGVRILLYRGTQGDRKGTQGDRKKDQSGVHIVKEVKETLETF